MSADADLRPRRSPIRLIVAFPGLAVPLRFDADPMALPDTRDGTAERFEAAVRRAGVRWVSGTFFDGGREIRAALDTHADLVIEAAPVEDGGTRCAAPLLIA